MCDANAAGSQRRLVLRWKGVAGAVAEVPLEAATADCTIFRDMADDLREEAMSSEDGSVTVDAPFDGAALSIVGRFVEGRHRGLFAPANGQSWADNEASELHAPFFKSILGDDERLEDGGIDALMAAMAAADFVRAEAFLAFGANYIVSRLAKATPVDVKRWCGQQGPLTPDEQQAILRMHQLLLDQQL